MRTIATTFGRGRRAALLAAAMAAAAGLAGCDDFMEVTNPGAVETEKLADTDYAALMVNGVVGEFQPTFGWVALWSGVFTDELRNHHSFAENPEIDRRDVNDGNGTYIAAVYNGLHRTRFLADSSTNMLKTLVPEGPERSLAVARVLTLGAYSWTLLGEQYCETPINRSAPVSSEQLLGDALTRFDEAIAAATAAKANAGSIASTTARNRLIAGADSLTNLARVGGARAALSLAASNSSFRQKALDYARAVTPAYASASAPGFRFDAIYGKDADRYTRRVSNPAYEFIPQGRWFSITGTPFEKLNDPRVPMSPTLVRMTDGTNRNIVNSPASYGTNDGTVVGKPIDIVSSIRIGSALEARYVIAEIEGLNGANLAFVNQRRAVGGQAALPATATAAEYMAALREQRARDFYLDSHRMGDIRRYKKAYNVDLWPSGSYFGSSTIQYGSQECWPIPAVEFNT